ncbi:MAG TPA: molybdate ABC transporter substrate-binding protein [Candidatus Limnocylindrales bacterium]|nr:molybdate ABC transporter substrate-binding protein [Candidatus Limnocylindrales bacterium]
MKLRLLGATLAAITVLGCSVTGGAPAAPSTSAPAVTSPSEASSASGRGVPVELTVYGAASLAGVLDAAKAAFETANPGLKLMISTDSSAALEMKIEQGAPADVFLAADTTNPKKLVDRGFASGDAVEFAGNELAIIVPKGNSAKISTPADLARSGVKVIAAGDEVPITKYAKQLVANLAKVSGYPSDFAAAYDRNVASKEDNVKAVVAKVGLGEGDAGIVYATDAKASRDVDTLAIPEGANVPVTYAGVVVKASPNTDAATAFLDWLTGPDGQAILKQSGFLPPPE